MSSAIASTSAQQLSAEAIAATHNVHYALSPRIGVLSSPDVLGVLEANHLTNFSDLLKPFEDSIESLTVRTSQLETRRCETFPLCFDSLDMFEPQAASASTSQLFTPADVVTSQQQTGEEAGAAAAASSKRRQPRYSRPELLLDAISARVSAKSKAVWEVRETPKRQHSRKYSSVGGNAESLKKFLSTGDEKDLERYRTSAIENLTPWFADTKTMILNSRNVSEHETFGHPLAVILIVSSNSSDPMNAFASLFEASAASVSRAFTHRPYVDPLILRYYVLLHDVASSGSDLAESIALLENIKKTYGLHCCLLPINSANAASETSSNVLETYKKAFRNERRPFRVGEGEETPPRVPVKDGEERDEGDAEEERDRWFEEKDANVAYGEAMNDEDLRRIRSFVRDFAAQSLIPFLERCVSLWNEQLAASRKGLTGRLLGVASRKFFSGASGRGSSATQPSASFATLGYYPHSTMEAQTRRLADFAFMTRDYKLAAAMYDLGRRDYANDKAAKYIAGANEMFGLSHLMMMLSSHSPPIDVDSYLASAGHHYLLAPRQKGSALQLDSLRATLLYYEVYQGLRFYRSAPSALVRTATEGSSDAENDLEVAGAMLLEQAAIANLRQTDRPALRKCALHLVMAAHRYRSCGQKHLSHRCFQGAAAFYQILQRHALGRGLDTAESDGRVGHDTDSDEDEKRERLADYIAQHEAVRASQWDLIQDHLEQELGQQASSDGQASQAALHFYNLLHRQSQSLSKSLEQNSAKHEKILQDFLNCSKYVDVDFSTLLRSHDSDAILPLVDCARSGLRIASGARSDDHQWKLLEAAAGLSDASQSGNLHLSGKATVHEAFWVDVILVNPLNTNLTVSQLTVELSNPDGLAIDDAIAVADKLDEVHFFPQEEKTVSLAITVKEVCTVRCTSVTYLLSGQVAFREPLSRRGNRLNSTKEQRASLSPLYAIDESFTVEVQKAKPRLEVSLSKVVSRLGLGEEVEVELLLKNQGKVALRQAQAHVNRPDAIVDRAQQSHVSSCDGETSLNNELSTSKAMVIALESGTLAGETTTAWPVVLRGSALGILNLRILFVYRSEEGELLTTQFQHAIQVDAVIDLSVQAGPSQVDDMSYHLQIDSINLIDPEEEERVTIDALSFVSPAWTLATPKVESTGLNDMPHMQRGTTSAVAINRPSSAAVHDVSYTVAQLQSVLIGRGIDKKLQPPPITVNTSQIGAPENRSISPFLFLARKEYRLSTLRQEYPSIQSTSELQRIFTLYEPGEMDVIAHWRLEKSKRRGQAFVFGLTLGPSDDHFEKLFVKSDDKATRSLYAEAEKEKAALWVDVARTRLHVEEDPILLDFLLPEKSVIAEKSKNAGGRKVISVEILLRNVSLLRSRDVVLQLDNSLPPSSALTNASSVGGVEHASYIDRLTFRTTLKAQQSSRVRVKASIHGAAARSVLLAPIQVKSVVSGAKSKEDERAFQRWEHCPSPVQVAPPSEG